MPESHNTPTPLWRRWRQGVAQSCRGLWRRGSSGVRAFLSDRFGAGEEREDGRHYDKARARFWDEFREGQREADTHSGKINR